MSLQKFIKFSKQAQITPASCTGALQFVEWMPSSLDLVYPGSSLPGRTNTFKMVDEIFVAKDFFVWTSFNTDPNDR